MFFVNIPLSLRYMITSTRGEILVEKFMNFFWRIQLLLLIVRSLCLIGSPNRWFRSSNRRSESIPWRRRSGIRSRFWSSIRICRSPPGRWWSFFRRCRSPPRRWGSFFRKCRSPPRRLFLLWEYVDRLLGDEDLWQDLTIFLGDGDQE